MKVNIKVSRPNYFYLRLGNEFDPKECFIEVFDNSKKFYQSEELVYLDKSLCK